MLTVNTTKKIFPSRFKIPVITLKQLHPLLTTPYTLALHPGAIHSSYPALVRGWGALLFAGANKKEGNSETSSSFN